MTASYRLNKTKSGRRRQSMIAPARGGYTTLVALSAAIAVLDLAAILATAAVAGKAATLIDGTRSNETHLGGAAAATILALAYASGRLALGTYFPPRARSVKRAAVAAIWSISLLFVASLTFVLNPLHGFSPTGWTILLLAGPPILCAANDAAVALLRHLPGLEVFFHHRVLLLGTPERLEDLGNTLAGEPTVAIAAAVAFRSEDIHSNIWKEDLALACALARLVQPDMVILGLPGSSTPKLLASALERLAEVPSTVALALDEVVRTANSPMRRFDLRAGLLVLCSEPFSMARGAAKRVFDLAVASLALVMLIPVFVVVAIAIKLDSPGPVLFRQRRYGLNLVGFRIFKFRTMHTLEDGRTVRQAVRGDPRVTRVGRFLRRWNIDELPQLLNVLGGSMSLVGPRPHAMAHDQAFQSTLSGYVRRHNAKPGITGWAQVNGFRGEISNDDALRGRLAHDLWYLNNWSLWLDIRIILLTIFSQKSYQNAF